MAERVPSPPADDHPHPHPPLFSSGTYVVQVPKDQIYRVPPPENALIVERHRNPAATSNRRCTCCLRLCISLAVLLLLLGIVAALLPVFVRPKPPKFKLNKFVVNNLHSRREFDIKLKVENPNGKGSISFKQGGRTSLSFRNHEVASGKYPAFRQQHGSSKQIALALPAKAAVALPKEMEKSFKNNRTKIHVSLSLKMKLPAKMKAALSTSRDVKFAVVCSFTVDTLAKGSRILSQECESERQ